MENSTKVTNKDIATEVESLIEKFPKYQKQLDGIRRKILVRERKLRVEGVFSDEPMKFEELSSKKFHQIFKGQPMGRAFSCAWVRTSFSLGENERNSDLFLRCDSGTEGLVYVNGKLASGISSKLCYVDRLQSARGKTLITLEESQDGNYVVYADLGYNGSQIAPPYGAAFFKQFELTRMNKPLFDFYYDILNFFYLYAVEKPSEKRTAMQGILDDAISLGSSKSARGSSKSALGVSKIDDFVEMQKTMSEFLSANSAEKNFTFTAIGHSHLDLAWLWPIRETKRKSVRTFKNQLNNLQKYPFYVYGASQPQQFQWLKDNEPEVFAQVANEIKQGRIEPQGGMWVEPDTILPSGESLIRQLYFGRKFFRENFGQTPKMCWLPDVFGYNGNLPQILKKSGVKYFMTIKLSWNQTNRFPHHTFIWEGIDGSGVLSHMPPDGDYNSGGTPACFERAYRNFREKEVSDRAMLVFGAGDGGGGAGEAHLELLKRSNQNDKNYTVEFATAETFFDEVEKNIEKIPKYKGELYFEKHQGTYTTQAETKKSNRKIEFLLHEVEYLCTHAYLKGESYPEAELESIWKELLLHQFHDILPGSAINRVYKESAKAYAQLENKLNVIKNNTLKAMEALQNTENSNGSALQNTKNSNGSALQNTENTNSSTLQKTENTNGSALQNTENSNGSTLQNTLIFNASPYSKKECIKIDGKWVQFDAPAYGSAEVQELSGTTELEVGKTFIKNKHLRAIFGKYGEIISLKGNDGFEFAKEYLNQLTIYHDPYSLFNAWDISESYLKKPKKILKPYKREFFVEGGAAICKNYFKHCRTKIVQKVILEKDLPYVKFETDVNWHETLRMLRCDFAPSVYGNRSICDLQMGSIERDTKNETSLQSAQYEVPAHKYVALEKDGKGVAVMSDCKYGYRIKDKTVSLNLLRSPIYPDIVADRGQHTFTYAFYPYDLADKKLVQYAYNLQVVPTVSPATISPLFVAENPEIVVETIKKSYTDCGIAVRLYNSSKSAQQTAIEILFAHANVFETNLVEEEKTPLTNKGTLNFTPFEIKTLYIETT